MRTRLLVAFMMSVLMLSAKEMRLRGGSLEAIDDVIIESLDDDMNFIMAYRFSDGTIHMGHSKGVHCVSQYGCSEISMDNGRTWRKPTAGCLGMNSYEGLDGVKYRIEHWDSKYLKEIPLRVVRFNDELQKVEYVRTCTIEMPKPSQFYLHRDVCRLKSGRLLATAYGNAEGEKKYNSFAICSDDDGLTWRYLSRIADDPEGKTAEGPDETTVFQLRDGRVCAIYRDDGMGYLKQCFSSDDGEHWTEPETLDFFKGAASPGGIVLSDGTVVVISGRPNVYLLVDFTGTCSNYQKFELYHGSSSSYGTVVEVAPNEILCLYDESNFGGWFSPTPFSHIHASRYKVNARDEAAEASSEYDVLFQPTTDAAVKADKILSPVYRSAVEQPECQSTYQVINIPERPHPVLRLISHADPESTVNGDNAWAKMVAQVNPLNAEEVTLGMEFRLNDMGEARPQLQFCGVVGAGTDDKGYLGFCRFSVDKIEIVREDGKFDVLDYDVGTARFHSFVLKLTLKDQMARLYLKGQDEPLMEVHLPKASGVPEINFGDASRSIHGSCDISYFGWRIR